MQRFISGSPLRTLVRVYVSVVIVALGLALAIFFLGTGPYRAENAGLFASIWLAFGALYVGYFVGALLRPHGVPAWQTNTLLCGLVLAPGALLYVSPLWGPIVFAVAVPCTLWLFVEASLARRPVP